MSFQAYLDTIKEKTGKGPDDFVALAADKGLLGPTVKAGDIVAWLAEDFGLGRGHAMAIVAVLKQQASPRTTRDDRIDKHFNGKKAVWKAPFDRLNAAIGAIGDDTAISPTDSYLSFIRGGKKFAIVQITGDRMDIGIKRKGTAPTERFVAAGNLNAMVTHRARLEPEAEIDDELIGWLRAAYDQAQ